MLRVDGIISGKTLFFTELEPMSLPLHGSSGTV